MRFKLIACEIFRREIGCLLPQSPHQVDVEFLPLGGHHDPEATRGELQRRVDDVEASEYDAILVGYCFCNTSITGLTANHTRLVLPRAYDCTAVLLGSSQRYKTSEEEHPGTFYFTYGRVEAWNSDRGHAVRIQSNGLARATAYQEMVKQHGEEQAKLLLEAKKDWSRPYFCGGFVNVGLEGDDEASKRVEETCRVNNWEFLEMKGDLGLLQRWLSGDWEAADFLIVQPGQRVEETFNDRIIEAKTVFSPLGRPGPQTAAPAAEQGAVSAAAGEAPDNGHEPKTDAQRTAEASEGQGPPPRDEGEVDTSLNLDDLLRTLVARGGSDLHIKAGQPPVIRVHGHLFRLDYKPMTPATTKALMYSIMDAERVQRYEEDMEMDLAHHIPGVARFRVNVLRQRFNVGGVMRQIPIDIKTIDEMNLPPMLKDLSMRPRGLILVTGPTGSGKSTTLASCIDHINLSRRAHVITVEDPIEFVHMDKKCIVEQRELGQDTHSFAESLKHVMRQAPDVILVGEMRDLETISLAITAAETGHLVFATLHTTDAAQTIDRIIDVFPPEQQEQIRAQLAITLEAVVSQTLMPLKGNPGRVAAFEIMVCTPAIRSLIREAKTHQMYTIIQSSADLGMIALDQSLLNLLQEDKIEWEMAVSKTSNLGDFVERAKRMGLAPATVETGGE